MNRMIWSLTLVAGTVASGSALGQATNPAPARKASTQAPAAAVPLTPAQVAAARAKDEEAMNRAALAMNPVLTEWEKRSAQISSLDAAFDMREISPGFGDKFYRGRAMLESPDKACLEFKLYKVDANNKPIILTDDKGKKVAQLEKEPEKRIVCTGTEVLQYVWENKTITVYPLDKQVRQKALQEGPLPFLFNMKAAEAKQRYWMGLQEEQTDQYVIDIMPRMEIDRDSFIQARLWLNKKTFLPNQLYLVKNGGKEAEKYTFDSPNNAVIANGKMDQKYFKFQNFDGWITKVNKDGPAKAPAAVQAPAGAAKPKQQAAQPGTRPNPR